MTSETSDVLLERMMRLHPKVIDLTLDRVHRLLHAMGHPETRLPPVIHVAGTNGKGSTVSMLRAGIEGIGQSAHVYTSPHLARFHERIRIAGALIAEDALSEILDECLLANGPNPITYFEITTVAALAAFARTPADWTLLEVGLGGRLDATNVVDHPHMSIITPVDLDHQQFLGETIEEIAAEKAGILKRGVPCVVGPQHESALEVIETIAARTGAPLFTHGQHWHVQEENGRLVYQDENGLRDLPSPNLLGPHQFVNAGMAIAALRCLGFPDVAFDAALQNAQWPARMQRLRKGPLFDLAGSAELWLDGGHNPAAGKVLAATLRTLPSRPLHLVCGMLRTKDAGGYLRAFDGLAESVTAIDIPGETATFSADETAAAAQSAGLNARTSPNLEAAVSAIARQSPGARILVCGSLYLAGHVLRENG